MNQASTKPPLFDTGFSDLRKKRALRQNPEPHFLNEWALKDITDRLDVIRRDFKETIMHGHNMDGITGPEKKLGTVTTLEMTGEDEILPLEVESCDLFISVNEIQRLNDPLTFLLQARHALKPDGFFICAFPGEMVLPELKDAVTQAEMNLRGGLSPRLLPTIAKADMGALMQRAGFALPVVDSETLHLSYKKLDTLYADIRALGGGNILSARDKRFAGKGFFNEVERIYAQNHKNEDGTYKATIEMVFAAGWAPHSSQQQPSERGSGTVSLTDIL
ncbi:MAG: methyltransferase domain-containing protein [Pseudobdellovibrionaceae bacterium]